MHFFFVFICQKNRQKQSAYLCNYNQTDYSHRPERVVKLKTLKKMNLLDLKNLEANVSVTINLTDLQQFAEGLISNTRRELEAEVIAAKEEKYLSRAETCELLKVDQSTLWRWARRGYLLPVEMGGRRLYKLSDLKRILNGGN